MTSFLDLPGLRKRITAEPRFARAMVEMGERLKLEPDYILAVMSRESGIDPQIVNPDGGATGLIQFMPKTAMGLGTTTTALRGMSAVEQLQYVERFFARNGEKIRRDVPGDYYMAVFMPAFVGFPEDFVLGEKDNPEIIAGLTKASIYKSNAGLDHGHTGKITVKDIWSAVDTTVAAARQKPRLEVDDGPLAPAGPSGPPVSVSPPLSLPPAWRSSLGRQDLPVLREGAKGTAVALAQWLLGSDVITGMFTEAFADDYVKPFQASRGLTSDGAIGPLTWYEMTLKAVK